MCLETATSKLHKNLGPMARCPVPGAGGLGPWALGPGAPGSRVPGPGSRGPGPWARGPRPGR